MRIHRTLRRSIQCMQRLVLDVLCESGTQETLHTVSFLYPRCAYGRWLQGQLLIAQEASTATAAAMKKTLKDQEAVIAKLEALLASAAARSKELEGWRSTAEALQQEATRLRCLAVQDAQAQLITNNT